MNTIDTNELKVKGLAQEFNQQPAQLASIDSLTSTIELNHTNDCLESMQAS